MKVCDWPANVQCVLGPTTSSIVTPPPANTSIGSTIQKDLVDGIFGLVGDEGSTTSSSTIQQVNVDDIFGNVDMATSTSKLSSPAGAEQEPEEEIIILPSTKSPPLGCNRDEWELALTSAPDTAFSASSSSACSNPWYARLEPEQDLSLFARSLFQTEQVQQLAQLIMDPCGK